MKAYKIGGYLHTKFTVIFTHTHTLSHTNVAHSRIHAKSANPKTSREINKNCAKQISSNLSYVSLLLPWPVITPFAYFAKLSQFFQII